MCAKSKLVEAVNGFAFRCAAIQIDIESVRPVTCAVSETGMALVEEQANKLEDELKSQPGPARQEVNILVRYDPQLIAMIGDRAMYEVTLETLPRGAA